MAEKMKKTSFDIPEDLWRRLKIRAVTEGATLRDVFVNAAEAYLRTKARKGGRDER